MLNRCADQKQQDCWRWRRDQKEEIVRETKGGQETVQDDRQRGDRARGVLVGATAIVTLFGEATRVQRGRVTMSCSILTGRQSTDQETVRLIIYICSFRHAGPSVDCLRQLTPNDVEYLSINK